MLQPQAVIFDIGNVLTRWQPEAFYDRVIGETRRRALFAEVDLHGMNDRVDEGALFRETIYDWAERYPEWAAEIRMWYDRWIELASPRIEGSIGLQRALRAKGVPPVNRRHTSAQASGLTTDQSSYTGCWFTVPASGGTSWALSVCPAFRMPRSTR